jgi:RNA polymerase primary sigma factor
VSDEPNPRLTQQQERDLVVAAEAGDAAARERLVEAFMPAIAGIARGYPSGGGVDRGELIQEGVAGLLFAARRYDFRLQTPFWAYATFWVRKAMQELAAEMGRPVSLSDRAVRSLARIRSARREHLQTHRSEPTIEDLSRATGFTPRQVDSLLATERIPRGLEEPVDPSEETAMTVGETIADPAAEEAYSGVLARIEISEVGELASRLEERERVVLRAHYGLGQSAQTLAQIGESLGLTAERVRQIEAAALRRLRDGLARPALPEERSV